MASSLLFKMVTNGKKEGVQMDESLPLQGDLYEQVSHVD